MLLGFVVLDDEGASHELALLQGLWRQGLRGWPLLGQAEGGASLGRKCGPELLDADPEQLGSGLEVGRT